MFEPTAEPAVETSAPAPAPGRRRTILAVATLVAVLGAGAALVAGDADTPEPLALVAGDASGAESARQASPGAYPVPSADRALALYPAGPGIQFRVRGDLPDLGDRADVWAVHSPDLDAAGFRRMARALGVGGEPVRGDDAWVAEDGAVSLSAWPGDGWSISFNHTRPEAGTAPPAGAPVGSATGAERLVRDLLQRMGVTEGEWETRSVPTEVGVGFGCAVPGKVAPERAVEDKAVEDNAVEDNAAEETVPADTPNSSDPDAPVSSEPASPVDCPPPPPPVPAYSVSLVPVLDGHRVEAMGWNVTLRQDGEIENLYGVWARFERRGAYKLRRVEAALDDLRSGGGPGPRPLPAEDAVEPAIAAEPAIGVAEAPAGVSEPYVGAPGAASVPMPAPPDGTVSIAPTPPCPVPGGVEEKMVASFPAVLGGTPGPGCGPVEPAVVTITDVELGLTAAHVFDDGTQRLHLVPAYRFLGTFEGGEPYESSVIALHPDAIAPPPPPGDGGREPAPMPMPADPVPPAAVDPAPAGAAPGGAGSGEPGWAGQKG